MVCGSVVGFAVGSVVTCSVEPVSGSVDVVTGAVDVVTGAVDDVTGAVDVTGSGDDVTVSNDAGSVVLQNTSEANINIYMYSYKLVFVQV